MLKLKLHVVVTVMLLWFVSQTRADLIVNGSFESPSIATGTFVGFAGGSTAISGWTVVGPEVAIVNNWTSVFGPTFQGQDGSQLVDLSGINSNSQANGIVQNVATTVGENYLLSFYVGSASGGNIFFPATVDLSIDGGARTSYHNPTAPGQMVDWLKFEVSFTAQNSMTSIAFFNGSGSNNRAVCLDSVSLEIHSVPESSMALPLATGLAGYFGLRRRRNRS